MGEYWLADGLHRLWAAQLAGHGEIEVEVREGMARDAWLWREATAH